MCLIAAFDFVEFPIGIDESGKGEVLLVVGIAVDQQFPDLALIVIEHVADHDDMGIVAGIPGTVDQIAFFAIVDVGVVCHNQLAGLV